MAPEIETDDLERFAGESGERFEVLFFEKSGSLGNVFDEINGVGPGGWNLRQSAC